MKKKTTKTIASIVINNAGKMEPHQRKDVAQWLRLHAKMIIKEGHEYSKIFKGKMFK